MFLFTSLTHNGSKLLLIFCFLKLLLEHDDHFIYLDSLPIKIKIYSLLRTAQYSSVQDLKNCDKSYDSFKILKLNQYKEYIRTMECSEIKYCYCGLHFSSAASTMHLPDGSNKYPTGMSVIPSTVQSVCDIRNTWHVGNFWTLLYTATSMVHSYKRYKGGNARKSRLKICYTL